jgi:3-oxoacyl-[acyl-carrier protein] reductase
MEIEHAGGRAMRLRADLRRLDQVRAAADRMSAQFGEIQVLISAAAIQGPIGPFFGNSPEDWAATIETNLVGTMHVCRVVIPEMVRRRRGKVILITGGGGAYPRPNFSAYAASKAGLLRFAETIAEEIRDHNVQVNCMAPGGTYTHMTDEILRAGDLAGDKDLNDALQVRITGGTQPEKQVELAMFLASERSNHISGKLIHVNDDWRRLEAAKLSPDLFTLRRLQKL